MTNLKDHTEDYILWHIPLLLVPISISCGAVFWSIAKLESQGFDEWIEGRVSGFTLLIAGGLCIVICIFNIGKNLYKFFKCRKSRTGT